MLYSDRVRESEEFQKSRRTVWPCLVAAIVFLFLNSAGPAHADRRVALVVGNSTYKTVARLDNPSNDARLIAEALRSLNFTLVGGGAQLDLDKPSLDRAVQSFGKQSRGADVALFYYAGHGVQVRGANYLVPIDANPTNEADVDFQMLDTNLVLRQMEAAGTRLNLVILDACRNNPFGGRGLRAATGGLAQMQAPEGTLISYATQPGNVADDGKDGNSPYTKALAQTIRKPGLGIFDAFNEVGLLVKRATRGAQQPWVSSSPIDGSFYFAGLSPAKSARIALALVAQDASKAAGAPLHVFGSAGETHGIERDVTLPGDIEDFRAIFDASRNPAVNLQLSKEALARINRNAELIGRQIALVLDGRTIVAVATVQTPLSSQLQLGGSFTMDEIKRLLGAVTNAPGAAR